MALSEQQNTAVELMAELTAIDPDTANKIPDNLRIQMCAKEPDKDKLSELIILCENSIRNAKKD